MAQFTKPQWFLPLMALTFLIVFGVYGQLQQSGGPGSSVSITGGNLTGSQSTNLAQVAGSTVATATTGIAKVGVTDGTGNAITSTTGALDINLKTGSIANTAFALNAGTASIGLVRIVPSACTQSTNFSSATVGVAITTGTTVTSTTTCVTLAYVNNTTNAAVTLRLADKQATPVIWLGGNADFSIPANSNMQIPLEGVTFTSGITAIAGTANALNLQINGLQ